MGKVSCIDSHILYCFSSYPKYHHSWQLSKEYVMYQNSLLLCSVPLAIEKIVHTFCFTRVWGLYLKAYCPFFFFPEKEHLHFEERSMGWQISLSSCRSSAYPRLAPVKCLLPSDRNSGLGVNYFSPATCILSLAELSATDTLEDSLEISTA